MPPDLDMWSITGAVAKTIGVPGTAGRPEAPQRYPWPGNIRELRNIVERAMIVASGDHLTIGIPAHSPSSSHRSDRLVDVEKQHILGVLESCGWRIRGAGRAADRLGLPPTTLETRMARLGLIRRKQP